MKRLLCGLLACVLLTSPIRANEPSNQKLVINEFMTGSEINPEKDAWIELYNPTNEAIDLEGWQIRGVTQGGSWIDISDEYQVEPGGYFLISHYTNSSNSILEPKPEINKTSILIPHDPIEIELKDPHGNISDQVVIQKDDQIPYRSYERLNPEVDGSDSSNWKRSDKQINLKANVENSFATPFSENSHKVIEAENQPPTAFIRTQGGTNYMTINITGEDSFDPDGDSLTFLWIYEPGVISERENPNRYTYSTPGQKIIQLTVTDSKGASSNATLSFEATEKVSEEIEIDKEKESNTAQGEAYKKGILQFTNVIPNPEGTDTDKEIIKLRNNSSTSIDLEGWRIKNRKGKEVEIEEGELEKGDSIKINPKKIGLSLINKSDSLTLMDPAGNRIDFIEWNEAESGEDIAKTRLYKDGMKGIVTEVIDGDTFKILVHNEEFTVRMIGVDTPETVDPSKSVEPFGLEASNYLKNLLTGKTVKLKFEEGKTDTYGRLLAYVYLGNELINATMIRKGFSPAYTRFPFRLKFQFIKYEGVAKMKGFGIWGIGPEIKPNKNSSRTIATFEPEIEIQSPRPIIIPKKECESTGLELSSILPNNQSGETQEYIELINNTDQTICLDSWKLDDIQEGGSKPFEMTGEIKPGETRRFHKSETKITLNDKDDCATLIDPEGEVADQICYQKTHKNEIFTHAGGNWIEKPKSSNQPKKAKAPTQEPQEFQWNLANNEYNGIIKAVDKEKEILYFETIPISYGNSAVNIELAEKLMDFNKPLTATVRANEETVHLIGLNQEKELTQNKKTVNPEIYYWVTLMTLITLIRIILRLTQKRIPTEIKFIQRPIS